MKVLKTVFLLLVTALLLQGCDEVRALLGKPTSADIAAMRDSIKEVRALRNASAANRDTVNPPAPDTLPAPAASPAAIPAAKPALCRYNVVSGAFSDRENAAKLESSLREEGYSPVSVKMKNGLIMVCALSTDDAPAAQKLADGMLAQGREVWIYDARTKKHED